VDLCGVGGSLHSRRRHYSHCPFFLSKWLSRGHLCRRDFSDGSLCRGGRQIAHHDPFLVVQRVRNDFRGSSRGGSNVFDWHGNRKNHGDRSLGSGRSSTNLRSLNVLSISLIQTPATEPKRATESGTSSRDYLNVSYAQTRDAVMNFLCIGSSWLATTQSSASVPTHCIIKSTHIRLQSNRIRTRVQTGSIRRLQRVP